MRKVAWSCPMLSTTLRLSTSLIRLSMLPRLLGGFRSLHCSRNTLTCSLHDSAMDVALGGVYSGVFSVRSSSFLSSYNVVIDGLCQWNSLLTNSGNTSTLQARSSTTASGACPLTTNMDHRFIPPTLTCRMCVIFLVLHPTETLTTIF